MKNYIIDVLLDIGIPSGVKGFIYIHEAMKLFDSDPYFMEGKICLLYETIAKQHSTTSSRVERAIRHAFDVAKKSHRDKEGYYIDPSETKNSNLLRTLYLRLKQDQDRKNKHGHYCDVENCVLMKQIYAEAANQISEEMQAALMRMMESIKNRIA